MQEAWLDLPDGAPELEYRPAPSMEEELEVIARLIKSRHIAGLPGHRELDRVCIVFPKPETYREMAGRVFKRYGIPIGSESASRTLLKSRPYRDLLAMVEAVADDYPRLTFARALASPFFGLIADSVKIGAARAALKPGMVKGYDAWRAVLKAEGAGEGADLVYQAIREFRMRLHNGSFVAMAEALRILADAIGFNPEPDDEGNEPETLADILQPLSLLDRLRDLSSPRLRPDESIHPMEAAPHQWIGEFIEALETVFGHETITDKTSRHGVQIMSIYEARGLAPDMLYMGGLRDGELPARPELDFLLPDTVRRGLGLVDMKRHLHLQEHIFTRLARAAGSVTLTYPEMDGDNLYLPSVFLDGMGENRLPIKGIYTEMEQMLAGCPPGGSAFVHEAPAVKVYQPEDSLRVTDVDAYRTCPRRFFIERVIGAEPAELAEYEVDARTTGTLSHLVMEHFMRSGGPLGSMAEDRLSEAIDIALKGQGLDPYFAGLFRETFMQALPEITKVEAKIEKDGYTFSEAERLVKGEPVPGIRLRGKVDRIDLDASGRASVMDYKTGTADISGSQVLAKGKALQMFLYAAMLKAEGLRPERVGLYTFGQIKTKFVPSSVDKRKALGMDEFMDAALGYLRETAARIWAGDFRATPIDESACFGCHEAPYCPYVQGTTKAEDAR
jgi:RecB family exonuclease